MGGGEGAGQGDGLLQRLHHRSEDSVAPTVGFRVNIDGLIQSPEVKLSLVVGKEIQQAKKIPMNAPGRGDNRGQQSATRSCWRPRWNDAGLQP